MYDADNAGVTGEDMMCDESQNDSAIPSAARMSSPDVEILV